jgi:hypothetical protein
MSSVQPIRITTDASAELFARLIDYAGLFPPASLDMAGAVNGYRMAREGPRSWIAGRFLVPASRLEELAAELVATMHEGEPPWPVSVVFDVDPGRAASAAAAFDSHMGPAAVVEFVEVRIPTGADRQSVSTLYGTAGAVGASVTPFLEVPRGPEWRDEMPEVIAAIAAARAEHARPGGAKIRCGGLTAEDFPTPEQVATFLVGVTEAGLPFKATAGLHHPLRHHDPVLGVDRHGFVNLLAATAAARAGMDHTTVTAAVAATDPGAFAIGSQGLSWDRVRVGLKDVQGLRHTGLVAYGSCDFDEPVDDLGTLGFLPR